MTYFSRTELAAIEKSLWKYTARNNETNWEVTGMILGKR